ncbi:MAG: type II toxin-antitoxin system VapC family toxin [Desertimonas sp.]
MVIDSSALAAVLFDEPERRVINERIEAADVRLMSAATLVEISIVVEARTGADGVRSLDEFIERAGIEIRSLDEAQARAARTAWSRYGKGRHPAGLNFGDCCSYALARTLSLPLLFKGDDFAATDIVSALS